MTVKCFSLVINVGPGLIVLIFHVNWLVKLLRSAKNAV